MCEHAIDTGKAVLTRSRPRRVPPKWKEEINSQLDEMLDQKLCKASHSPWASNVVLVPKKDGLQRFAIDYRELNNATKKDAYGTPQVQTILDKLRDYSYFSVIDISAAYWCVPVREEDREKTAFNTPRGLFEMCVMPFGLVNSQATFQRLMDNTLQGLTRTESYIDDCIIYSRSFEEHLKELRAVFQRLQSAKLHVKLRKCQFFREEVEFLGHVVSREGRRPLVSAAKNSLCFLDPKA
ncbi:Retrovirus-related Pol polyprotein from transposon 17.6 [Oopsacas minuta]|uniref:Retrovirus-related Pol polyprotein from transposon 17.6 n=1 Tax=Oopsacas minuta TaxID=111878 RepID=A0AAV7KJL8_9METZ|nr:Retrovirus-related Pol polyprotein from transposon 17.6 [Oopsacas minuta]